jgi:Zn-dependent peptidase ImmA (M78 family)
MSFAAQSADHLIDSLGITKRSDLLLLEEIAWTRGILVKEGLLEGSEARLVMAKGRGVITISSSIQDLRRKRFSIAHELGHFELHRAQRGLSLCLSEDIRDGVSRTAGQDLEQEANEFASALLLPYRFFAPLCKNQEPSLDYIAHLANDFSTSLTATALRYLNFCEEPVAIVYSHDNRIQWFQGSKDFETTREDLEFFIDVRARLDRSSLAATMFQGRNLPSKMSRVLASSWFTSGRYEQNATILEHSYFMPTYNATLTLLWIDENIENEDEELTED